MVKCPYCGYDGKSELLKMRKFGFYKVEKLRALSAVEFFNHYQGLAL